MKSGGGDQQAATFIIRLWQETPETLVTPSVWRGMAIHVQSGAQRGIRNIDELVGFITTWIGEHTPEDNAS